MLFNLDQVLSINTTKHSHSNIFDDRNSSFIIFITNSIKLFPTQRELKGL